MRIIIDAMGGDNAPASVVEGAVRAADAYSDAEIVLCGREEDIRRAAKNADVSLEKIEIIEASDMLTMEDDPLSVMKEKKNSSMAVGLRALKEYGDAFISAGNTGALLAGSSLIIRCPSGIHRAAIATVLPLKVPVLLLDSGANVVAQPEHYEQWALAGSIYANCVMGVDEPRVGLLNNGSEDCKGTPTVVEAYKRLSTLEGINFIGNVEARDVPEGVCDVLVTDGFTGNILLKYTEGMGSMLFSFIKKLFMRNTFTKFAILGFKGALSDMKKSFDSSEYGAAPFIGLNKPVFKAHGNSDSRAIYNAVRQAVRYIDNDTAAEICSAAEYLDTRQTKDSDDH